MKSYITSLFLGAAAASVSIANADDLNWLVMADWGGQPSNPYTTPQELSTAKGMGIVGQQMNAKFALAVGDNFYSTGIRTDVHDQRFKSTFEDVFTHPHLQGPDFKFHVIAGNHDHGGNVTAQIEYTKLSTRWNYPAPWFSITEQLDNNATLQIIMLDTVILAGNSDVHDKYGDVVRELHGDELPGPADPLLATAEMEWFEATLKNSTATFLVVAGHFPVWSICEHGPTDFMVESVKPLMEQYHVTAFIAGHDHCIETFTDGGIDYHGMGASHINSPSQAHKDKVPTGSLKFYTEGTSGGFGSFTVNSTSFIARQHQGDGTLIYTTPTRFPRNQTPTPPPTPPSPAPPAPPSPPTPPAPPTPGGMVWECHGGAIVDVKKLTGITDQDLKKRKNSGLTACEAACIQTPTCVALYVHEVDEHCHVLLGAAKPTHAQFVAALKPKKKHSSCILVPKPPSVVHV